MLNHVVNFFFGCTHKNTTFPISPRAANSRLKPAHTYIVCLDCGREFPYSWEEMRMLSDSTAVPPAVPEQVRSFSATK